MVSAKAENGVIQNHSIMKEPSCARVGGRESMASQIVIDWFLLLQKMKPYEMAS